MIEKTSNNFPSRCGHPRALFPKGRSWLNAFFKGALKPFTGIFLALLPGLWSPAAAEIVDRVVARVNNDIVTLSAVQDKAIFLAQTGGRAAFPPGTSEQEILETALESIIQEKLQIQEGKKLGLEVSDDTVLKAIEDIKTKNGLNDETLRQMLQNEKTTFEEYKENIRKQILKSKAVSFQLRNRIKVSEKSMKRYYLDHKDDFRIPEKIHARHILFIFDPDITEEQKNLKKSKAREVLNKLRAGADFKDMAQKYSEDVSASNGGDLGFLEQGKMVAPFEQAAFKLKPGKVSDIVATPYGLHIIKVDKYVSGGIKPYLEVKDEIEQSLFSRKRASEFKAWMEELRGASFIEVTLFDGYEERRRNRLGEGGVNSASKDQNEETHPGHEPRPLFSTATSPSPVKARKIPAARKGNGSHPGQKPDYDNLKKKLRYIKSLRKRKKISESEYQKRKKALLKQL